MNNRQSGRRRGRNNNQRQSGQGRNVDQGNRIDSRARGNAAQMLEKYRNMARDAQLSSDRVMMEYYLQFADHYFRVLSDSRSRQEEQRSRSEGRDDSQEYRRDGRDDSDRDDANDTDRDDDGNDISDELDAIDTIGRAPRNRESRDERRDDRRNDRSGRPERNGRGNGGADGNGRANGNVQDADEGRLSIDAAILPPAIGAGDAVAQDGAAAPAKRRPRARKTETADDSTVA